MAAIEGEEISNSPGRTTTAASSTCRAAAQFSNQLRTRLGINPVAFNASKTRSAFAASISAAFESAGFSSKSMRQRLSRRVTSPAKFWRSRSHTSLARNPEAISSYKTTAASSLTAIPLSTSKQKESQTLYLLRRLTTSPQSHEFANESYSLFVRSAHLVAAEVTAAPTAKNQPRYSAARMFGMN